MASVVERTDQATVFDSDSDDDRPNREPEFIIHVVDDHHRPRPAPPSQMQRPPAFQPPAFQPQALPPPRVDKLHGKKCSACFIIRVIHCALVMALAAFTVSVGSRVPKEFIDGAYLTMCPAFIFVLAFTWICFADLGDVGDEDE